MGTRDDCPSLTLKPKMVHLSANSMRATLTQASKMMAHQIVHGFYYAAGSLLENARKRPELALGQQRFDFCGYLGALGDDAFPVEVNIVAVKFGMPAHERVQVLNRNSLLLDKPQCDGVAGGDALVRGFGGVFGRCGWRVFQGCRADPHQPCVWRVFLNGLEKFRERLAIFVFGVLPPMHAVVEDNDVESGRGQRRFDLLGEHRVRDEGRTGQPSYISFAGKQPLYFGIVIARDGIAD